MLDINIHPTAKIECDNFHAGQGTIIRAHAEIYGTQVSLGRECFIDEYAVIGGGSAYDPQAELIAGDWLHMGMFSQINIARGVYIQNEVGLGIGTRVFTHGAYLSEWEGFPSSFESVYIGKKVWLPNAQVNPGITIGDNVVVTAGSVITQDLPSGCLSGGSPAKTIKLNAYPKEFSLEEKDYLAKYYIKELDFLGVKGVICNDSRTLHYRDTSFDLDKRTITGPVTQETEVIKNQLRRHGIRFAYESVDGYYESW